MKTNVDSSLTYAKRALVLSQKTGRSPWVLLSLQKMGKAHARSGNTNEAIEQFRFMLKLATEEKEEKMVTKALLGLGSIYTIQSNYELATSHFLQALQAIESYSDELQRAAVLNNLSEVYFRMNRYSESITSLHKAKSIWQKHHYQQQVSKALNNLAIIYKHINKKDSAMLAYEKALTIKEKLADSIGMANVLNNIGVLLLSKSEFNAARSYFERSFELIEKAGFPAREAMVLSNIGKSSLYLGDLKQAEKHLMASLEVCITIDNKSVELDNYLSLAKVFLALGKPKLGIHYDKKYKALADSLDNSEVKRKVLELEAKYELEKKEKLLLLKTKENEILRQRIILYLVAFFLGVIILLVRNSYRSGLAKIKLDTKNRELAQMALQVNQQSTLLSNVKSQIIHMLTEEKDPEIQASRIEKALDSQVNESEVWDSLRFHFEQVHPKFFQRLNLKYDALTQYDLKFCAFIRINLENKEIARLLNITLKGVHQTRWRLKKKLDLSKNNDLDQFIIRF